MFVQIFRKEPFFYGHDNYDQLVKIAKVCEILHEGAYLHCLFYKNLYIFEYVNIWSERKAVFYVNTKSEAYAFCFTVLLQLTVFMIL